MNELPLDHHSTSLDCRVATSRDAVDWLRVPGCSASPWIIPRPGDIAMLMPLLGPYELEPRSGHLLTAVCSCASQDQVTTSLVSLLRWRAAAAAAEAEHLRIRRSTLPFRGAPRYRGVANKTDRGGVRGGAVATGRGGVGSVSTGCGGTDLSRRGRPVARLDVAELRAAGAASLRKMALLLLGINDGCLRS
eukprot:4269247-Prymnesium_polylepis.2